MFDSDGDLKSPYEKDSKRGGRLSGRRFVLSFFGGIALVVFLLFLVFSVSNIGALSFAGVGGIYTNIETLQGNNLAAYPYPTETAACQANFSDPTVGRPSEQALTALKADVEQLVIPADSNLTLAKDIRVPEIAGIDSVRVLIERTGVEQNPNYPPQAPTGPPSVGENPGALVDIIDFAGVFVRTGTNDGYSDLRFQRTRNITGGESPPIRLVAEREFGYGERADAMDYPLASGINPTRYIDGVTLQNISNTGTGDDGGYADYTDQINSFDNATTPDGNLTRGDGTPITVDAQASGPDYSQPDPPDSPYGDNTDSTVDDVRFAGIDNVNTDDTGYNDFTGLTTQRLTKGGTANIVVNGSKDIGNGYFQATEASCSLSNPNTDYGIDFHYADMPFASGLDESGSAGCDDYTAYTATAGAPEPTGVSPGGSFEVRMDVRATGESNTGFKKPEAPGLTIAKAFFDTDQDGTFEQDQVVGVFSVDPAEGDPLSDAGEVSTTLTIPPSTEPGTTTVRLRTIGSSPQCEEDDTACGQQQTPSVGYGANECDSAFDGDPSNTFNYGCDSAEFSFHVTPRSQVSAFFDWNQNGTAASEVQLLDETNKDAVYNITQNVQIPSDAKSGAGRFRVVHYNEFEAISSSPIVPYNGETQDYTFEVENDHTNAAVWAFFDWNQDGAIDDSQLVDFNTNGPTGAWTAQGNIVPPDYAKGGPTFMRIVHQQDGYDISTQNYPEPGPDEVDTVDGEYEDYTVNVEPEASYVRMWVDWNGDGNPTTVIDRGPLLEGNDTRRFELNENVDAPATVTPGYRLARVTHKQEPTTEGPPAYDEGERGWDGETLDFTVVTNPNPGDISDDGNITLGDVSFVATQLNATEVNLQGDVLIEESYTDNTTENPKFGPDGEFILSGNDAELTNVIGVVHSISFSFFDFPGIRFVLDYNPTPRRDVGATCQAYP